MLLLLTFGKKHLTTARRKFAQWQIFTRRCSKSNAMVIGCKISMLSTLDSAFLFMSDSSDFQAQTKIFSRRDVFSKAKPVRRPLVSALRSGKLPEEKFGTGARRTFTSVMPRW